MTDQRPEAVAMAFTDHDMGSAAEIAHAFAGDGGRIATLPDIVDARSHCAHDAIAWHAGITTSSMEFVGLSKTGVPVAAVAHDGGPLADPEFLIAAALVADDLGGAFRLPVRGFHSLLDGLFGDVEIYDIREAVRRREFHLQQPMRADQALEDPMVRARLGPRAEEFLEQLRKRNRTWRDENGHYASDGKCVIWTHDPEDYSYFLLDGIDEDAIVHPLVISGEKACRHCHFGGDGPDDHTCLVTSLGCHGWRGKATVVGVRGEGPLGRIHPGIDAVVAWFGEHHAEAMRENRRMPARHPKGPIIEIGGLWFTCHPRVGTGTDQPYPCFPVRTISAVRRNIEVTVPYRGDVHRLVYDREEVIAELPFRANAYHVVDEPNPGWFRDDDAPSHVTVHVDAYDITVDDARYVPHFANLRADFDRVLRFPTDMPSAL